MSGELAILTTGTGDRIDGMWSFERLPITHSAQVLVISPEAEIQHRLAQQLAEAIKDQGDVHGGTFPGLCHVECILEWPAPPGVERLLVVVLDNDKLLPPRLEILADWVLSQPGVRGLGVLRGSVSVERLPAPASRFQIARYLGDVGEAVEDVLAAIGANPEERKVFLSYDHRDTPAALELADALSQERFQVFLDTRSIPPASVWQDVLRDSIVDAGLVVVLETAHSVESSWVQREIGFAQARGAGVIAVQPAPTKEFSTPAARFLGPPGAAGPFVARQHRLQLAAQRAVRIASVESALNAPANGSEVRTARFCIGVHERPVSVRDLRRIAESAGNSGLRAATYSPKPVLSAKRRDRRWIHHESDTLDIPYGAIGQLGSRLV